MRFDLAHLPTDVDTLHRIIAMQAAEREAREGELAAAKAGLLAKTLEIEKLKLQLARLRRMQFGRSSEKIAREIEQLELRLEDLEAEATASTEAAAAPASDVKPSSSSAERKKSGCQPTGTFAAPRGRA
jgi:transposase